MTLDEFRKTKPRHLRLGQHFINAYWSLPASTKLSSTMYQLNDGAELFHYIFLFMKQKGWEELPPLPESYAEQINLFSKEQ